jgi:hypothetical protein
LGLEVKAISTLNVAPNHDPFAFLTARRIIALQHAILGKQRTKAA